MTQYVSHALFHIHTLVYSAGTECLASTCKVLKNDVSYSTAVGLGSMGKARDLVAAHHTPMT
jgi:hypothetical protein